MSAHWISFICGMFLGSLTGITIMCLCFIAKLDDFHREIIMQKKDSSSF
jgi:hypothetical protein